MAVEELLKEEEELFQKVRDYISKTGDTGFLRILEVLEEEAYAISEHIQTNWGDKALADFWTKIAKKTATISTKIADAFGTGHLR